MHKVIFQINSNFENLQCYPRQYSDITPEKAHIYIVTNLLHIARQTKLLTRESVLNKIQYTSLKVLLLQEMRQCHLNS